MGVISTVSPLLISGMINTAILIASAWHNSKSLNQAVKFVDRPKPELNATLNDVNEILDEIPQQQSNEVGQSIFGKLWDTTKSAWNNLTFTIKTLMLSGVALASIIPLLKLFFDVLSKRSAASAVGYVNPNIKIEPHNENKFEPEIDHDEDYNPNLMQNYVPTINVNTNKEQPQIVISPSVPIYVPYEPGYKQKPKINPKNPYNWIWEQKYKSGPLGGSPGFSNI